MTGTGKFLKEMLPSPGGLTSEGAKALMLKDSDYSTPSDHYFAYLQKIKTEGNEATEKMVL